MAETIISRAAVCCDFVRVLKNPLDVPAIEFLTSAGLASGSNCSSSLVVLLTKIAPAIPRAKTIPPSWAGLLNVSPKTEKGHMNWRSLTNHHEAQGPWDLSFRYLCLHHTITCLIIGTHAQRHQSCVSVDCASRGIGLDAI